MAEIFFKGKRQRVHFLHVGKTGGSAVKSVLNDFRETPEYSLVLHGHKISLRDVPNGELVVFFLRDPISRFVSGFYSRQRKGEPCYSIKWRPIEKEVFQRFSTPNEMAVSLADERSSGHALAVRAMESVNHFKPYSKWYIDFDYFRSRTDDILFIGFKESLDADFIQLKRIFKIHQDIHLPTDDITAHRNPTNLNKYIDEQGIAALREWYSEDYRFISLCKEILSSRANSCDP